MRPIEIGTLGLFVFGPILLTVEAILVWHRRVLWNRRVRDASEAPAGFPGGRFSWYLALRCLPAFGVIAWGCGLTALVVVTPVGCQSTACNALSELAIVGLIVALIGVCLVLAVVGRNRPRFIVPPWLRDDLRTPPRAGQSRERRPRAPAHRDRSIP